MRTQRAHGHSFQPFLAPTPTPQAAREADARPRDPQRHPFAHLNDFRWHDCPFHPFPPLHAAQGAGPRCRAGTFRAHLGPHLE